MFSISYSSKFHEFEGQLSKSNLVWGLSWVYLSIWYLNCDRKPSQIVIAWTICTIYEKLQSSTHHKPCLADSLKALRASSSKEEDRSSYKHVALIWRPKSSGHPHRFSTTRQVNCWFNATYDECPNDSNQLGRNTFCTTCGNAKQAHRSPQEASWLPLSWEGSEHPGLASTEQRHGSGKTE